ncbi:LamG-like jellyroll fold domain-containing protein [Paenibacillus terrigena]|uniref:LamG-like jellyroll fold domain-containing protein n=1 Tax=Paenibacillus terrigena TaxID=369333 RepID=UPI0003798232|nr:LamG-like jellyroll fold domain-containing protein [Paenibacillus terrigena]
MKKLKRAVAGLLSIAIALSMGVSPAAALQQQDSSADAAPPQLTIASYNIAANQHPDLGKIASLLRLHNVDVAGFQEVDVYTSRNNTDMLEVIRNKGGFAAKSFRKNIDYGGGAYGVGIVADYAIVQESGAALESGRYEGRGYQRAEMKVGGKTIAVYNTHLTWEDQNIRRVQMEAVRNAMEADTAEYKVLTGDFNAQENNDEFDLFLGEFNIANGYKGKWLDTYIPVDASMQTNAIDNIITTRNMRVVEVKADDGEGIGSDHRLLLATYELLDESEVSTQLLDKKLVKAKALLQKTNLYTEKSLAALAEAVSKVESATNTSTQDAVNKEVDALEAAIKALEPVPADMVAHWSFDGVDPLKDQTGRGNDGKAVGKVAYEKSLTNLGQALSTKDGYVSVAKMTEDLKLGTDNYSVAFWYKASNPGTWSAVLGDKDWNSGGNPGMAVVQGQGQFYTTFAPANKSARYENIVPGTAGKVYDGNWHYVAATLDRSGDSLLYVDGKQIASTSLKKAKGESATTNLPFNIGADGAGGYRINSLIDEVKVYRVVLTPEEIVQEYEANRNNSQDMMKDAVAKVEKNLANMVIDPATSTQMPEYTLAGGEITAKLFASENDIVINDKGKILHQPLVDKKVQITYVVKNTKDGKEELVQNKWITVRGSGTTGSNPMPKVVPSLQEWRGENGGTFALKEGSRIIVSATESTKLRKAAEITKSDIKELFDLNVHISEDAPRSGDIVLTMTQAEANLGEQGYTMEVGDYVTITGNAYRGVFFGTRSVLQGILTSGNQTIAKGVAADYPNYEIRKFMLDIGRKYFPMWYLKDVVKYAAWYKFTDFQAHLSEDTFNNYSAFRLESKIPHLTSTDGHYTKEEYRQFQYDAMDYGVRIITEIDGPAHARQFINLGKYPDSPEKYKNLGMDATHFDLRANGARQKVFDLMDEVLEEYLGGTDPVIVTDAFDVGMDEYSGNKNDLRAYAEHMYDKLMNTYHVQPFAWDSDASLRNEAYPDLPTEPIINFWKWEEVTGGVKALMDQGHRIVNGDHRWYIVPGGQIGFSDFLDQERLYRELSAGDMTGWYGGGMVFPEGHPNIIGGTSLIWNDRGMFAGFTVYDIFARQQSQIPIFSQTYWYGREEGESYAQFKEKVDTVGVGPGLDNLNKAIKSNGSLVYDFNMEKLDGITVRDQSPNGYDATVTNGTLTDGIEGKQLTFRGDGYLKAKHSALKWPYTAMFDLTIDEEQTGDITLFEEEMPVQQGAIQSGKPTGHEKRSITLKNQGDGTYALTYSREAFTFKHDYTFEKGRAYRIAFVSDEAKRKSDFTDFEQTNKLYVNGELVSTLYGPKKPEDFTGQYWWVDSPSLNMPLEKIGYGLVGSLDNFKLYNYVMSDQEVKEAAVDFGGSTEVEDKNIALNKPATASSFKNNSMIAANATDGNLGTRWGSNYSSNNNEPSKTEWLRIDLGGEYSLREVILHWEKAYAEEYQIQVSLDGETFKDAKVITNGKGGEETILLDNIPARYLRILFTKHHPSEDSWQWNYGYSLFEVEVYQSQQRDLLLLAVQRAKEALGAYQPGNNTGQIPEARYKELQDQIKQAEDAAKDPALTADAAKAHRAAMQKIIDNIGDEVIQIAAVKLTGPALVMKGEPFTVRLGLKQVHEPIFAQDMLVQYDPNLYEFKEAVAALDGLTVYTQPAQTPGQLRLIIASLGADHAITNDADVVELKFAAKQVPQSASGTIAVTSASIGNAEGHESAALPASVTVEVTATIELPGDVNHDGKYSIADLAIAAAHYGMTKEHPDWNKYKSADMDGNGVIDIVDLAAIAKKIIEA